jgi:hypothetical protein
MEKGIVYAKEVPSSDGVISLSVKVMQDADYNGIEGKLHIKSLKLI